MPCLVACKQARGWPWQVTGAAFPTRWHPTHIAARAGSLRATRRVDGGRSALGFGPVQLFPWRFLAPSSVRRRRTPRCGGAHRDRPHRIGRHSTHLHHAGWPGACVRIHPVARQPLHAERVSPAAPMRTVWLVSEHHSERPPRRAGKALQAVFRAREYPPPRITFCTTAIGTPRPR